MKKKFVGIVLALTVATSLMACSFDSASSSSKEDLSKKSIDRDYRVKRRFRK